AGPGGVEVADVDRAEVHQVAAPGGRELALTGADANAGRMAHVPHGAPVVVPAARLLEPVEVAVLDEARKADRLPRRPCLIRVCDEHEVGPRGFPRRPEPLRVLLRRQPADL